MAKVNFEVLGEELQRKEKAAVFRATTDSKGKIGELWVSQGGIRWYPKNARKDSPKPRLFRWEDLTNVLRKA
jgi:hypothetical protein